MKSASVARQVQFAVSLLLCVVGANLAHMAASGQAVQKQPGPHIVDGVDCSQLAALGIDKQTSLHAAAIRIACGTESPGEAGPAASENPVPDPLGPYTNVDAVTGPEVYPHVTQSESTIYSSDGNTIVVSYNDSNTAPGNYSGVSVSNDGGATFTRLLPAPFAVGHGTNFGDPIVVYDQNLSTWFAGDLATGCGGQGIGLWTSSDGTGWTTGACAHSGSRDDRESMWVDNGPASPFYGRMYVSWNDYTFGNAAISVTSSDDGTTWSAPVRLNPGGGFLRNVQLTGGPDGTVYLAAMDEGGGGLAMRQNWVFKSGDGGATWTGNVFGARFPAPGDSLCPGSPYFARITPIWRFMGWGQPAVGPDGTVHYVYAGGRTGDSGDIYYTQSQDGGVTWSAPIVLNTDAPTGTRAQWMPSLSVTGDAAVLATWYDRRNSTDGTNYEVWGRRSADNGVTWLTDEPISDQLIPQPEQPDPNVQSCYAGDYNYATAFGTTHFATWTDGRNQVMGHFQQDVEFAAVPEATASGFSLSVDPSALTIPPGGSDVSTVTVTSTGGFSAPVTLGCDSGPAGITCGFDSNPVTPLPNNSATSTLTVSVDPGVPNGGYDFNVNGTSGSTTQTSPFHVDVVSTPSGVGSLRVKRTASQ
jgi:hypothetical protein